MRVLRTKIEYLKSAATLSKEVLWVSVGQRVAELLAVKVGGQKKILPFDTRRAEWQNSF